MRRAFLELLSAVYPQSADQPVSPVAVQFDVAGEAHRGMIVELTEDGARLETEVAPPVGSAIQIGRVSARVVELVPKGVVIAFSDIAD